MPNGIEPERSPILVFDVNETLLDVDALRPLFDETFGQGAALREWFANLLLYSQTVTLTEQYAAFSTLARHALEMTALTRGVPLTENAANAILSGMKRLPPHAGVSSALERLRSTGFRIMALTNSPKSLVLEQLQIANLAHQFERVFSVDAVRKFKPHPDAYWHVANELQVPTSALTMIAAHPWDLLGAKAVGYNVAFIERPHRPWFPLTNRPLISGTSLDEVVSQLILQREGVHGH